MFERIDNFQKNCNKTTPLKDYCNIKAGPNLKNSFFPDNLEKYLNLYKHFIKIGINPIVLGSATNSLLSSSLSNYPVIFTTGLNNSKINQDSITVDCGYSLSMLINKAIEAGFGGIWELAGIPGTIGGALYSNSGSKSSTISDYLTSVSVFTKNNNFITLKKSECQFGYRNSIFKNLEGIILSATFSFPQVSSKVEKEDINRNKEIILNSKIEKGLFDYPSLGSYFKNPINKSAGALLEKVGAKTLSIGGAAINPKHANQLINKSGTATAEDIYNLGLLCQEKVEHSFSIKLEKEISTFGF